MSDLFWRAPLFAERKHQELEELMEERNRLQIILTWPDEEDVPFLEEHEERLDDINREIIYLERELGL